MTREPQVGDTVKIGICKCEFFDKCKNRGLEFGIIIKKEAYENIPFSKIYRIKWADKKTDKYYKCTFRESWFVVIKEAKRGNSSNCVNCMGCDKMFQPSDCPFKCEKYYELVEKVINALK